MTRKAGDTWDLASSVGATATSVAASRALASRGPNPLIDDPYAEPLWQVSVATTAQAYTANGFEPPHAELLAMIGDSGYLTAELSGPPN